MTGPGGQFQVPALQQDDPWLARTLAMMVPCGFCWAEHNKACTSEGQHLERYLRAYRRGLISREAMQAVCATLGPISPGKLVPDKHVPVGGQPVRKPHERA
jgi:hypothetical protein